MQNDTPQSPVSGEIQAEVTTGGEIPTLASDVEKRFDEEFGYLLHEIVDGDWCPASGMPYFNPFGSTSTTKSNPNYRIVNPVYKCECGGDEKIAKIKHFLATELERQRREYVEAVHKVAVKIVSGDQLLQERTIKRTLEACKKAILKKARE